MGRRGVDHRPRPAVAAIAHIGDRRLRHAGRGDFGWGRLPGAVRGRWRGCRRSASSVWVPVVDSADRVGVLGISVAEPVEDVVDGFRRSCLAVW